MPVDKFDITKRLKALAINTGKICLTLPYNVVNKNYINQIVKCSSAASSKYRVAYKGRLKPEFLKKLRIVEYELEETIHFYELLIEFNVEYKKELKELNKESSQLLSIVVDYIKVTKSMPVEIESIIKIKTI